MESKWISVKDRLPEDGVSALVYVPRGPENYLRYRTAWIDYDSTPAQWIYKGNVLEGVTYWQPLPEPPDGE